MLEQATFDQFLASLKFAPNPFQLKVLESIANGSGNILVSALAGSGKTSLLVQCAHLLDVMGESSSMFMAFNVKIRDELNKRLPRPLATNSHRLGLQVLNSVRKTQTDTNKWYNLSKEIIQQAHFDTREEYQKTRALTALCSKVMLNNVAPDSTADIISIAMRYRIEGVYSDDDNRIDGRMIPLVKKAIDRAIEMWRNVGTVSFDEMLYLPIALSLQPTQYQWVFVDEAQDLNILQQELAFRSCAPGGRMVFVGDKRQAIYGFAGADAASFERIALHTKAMVLPLNTCYRCPTSVINMAKAIVPELEAAPNAAEGVIEYQKPEDLWKLAKRGALVMCRLNAPLISAYFDLIAHQIPAKVMGKDIGADLVRTLERIAELDGFSYGEAIKYMELFREQQLRILSQKQNAESQIEILNDKIDCLIVCVENFACSTLQCLKDVMKDLFGDEDKENWSNVVALCTVHKAKGLEAQETFILKPEKMPLTWPGQQQWEAEQEMNIKYVCYTRSLRRMVILGDAPLPAPVALPVSPAGEQHAEVVAAYQQGDYDPVENDEHQPEEAPLPVISATVTNVPAVIPGSETNFDQIRARFMAAAKPLVPPAAQPPQQLTLLPEPSPLQKLISEMSADDLRRTIKLLEVALAEKEVA